MVEGFSKKTQPVPDNSNNIVTLDACQLSGTVGATIGTSDPKYVSSGQNCTQYCKVNKPEDSTGAGGVSTCGYKTSTGTLSVAGSKQYCSCAYSDYGNV